MSSFTVNGAALVLRPAWLVQDALNTVTRGLGCLCTGPTVQVTGPLTESAPLVATVTSLVYQPFVPAVPAVTVSIADGSVRSILKAALLIPVFVLPARSEHAPDDTVTPAPSSDPVETSFGKLAEQAALRPEPPCRSP